MPRFFLIVFAAFALRTAGAADVCQIDESVAYAPRANCAFPTCPSGAHCPASELALDRMASSVELSDPLITWLAACPDSAIAGGCWQATFEVQLRLGVTGNTDTVGIKLTTESEQQATGKNYFVKPERISDSRVQARLDLVYYVAPSQSFSLKVDALCAKGKTGRELCVAPLASNLRLSWGNGARTATRPSR